MKLFELNEKKQVARENGFKFNQTKKLIKDFYSHHCYINLRYYQKYSLRLVYRNVFRTHSQDRENMENLIIF